MLEITAADAAASFGFKDETVKRPWMASQRLAEVSAHTPLEAINNSVGMAFKKTTLHLEKRWDRLTLLYI